MLSVSQSSTFSGAILVNSSLPGSALGSSEAPPLSYALLENCLLQFIREHWKARRVWSKPLHASQTPGFPSCRKPTCTQAADSSRGVKTSKGDHLP